MATTTTTTASVKTHLSLTGPVIVPAWVWTCSHDKGSPAKLMISASWPQDLGYSPATAASGCGETLVFIESAGDP